MKTDFDKIKVALVHDFFKMQGGAENVFTEIYNLFPKADIFTALKYNTPKINNLFRKETKIYQTFISKLPFNKKLFNIYKIFLPLAFENLDLSRYDLVISDTASFAKSVIINPDAVHISYIHTPPRFLWGLPTSTQDRLPGIFKIPLLFINHYLRICDYISAQRPDLLIANSVETQKRISKSYKRSSTIIFPPVKVKELQAKFKQYQTKITQVKQKYNIPINKPYFLVVDRLEKYKKIQNLIMAYQDNPYLQQQVDIVIVGQGDYRTELEKLAQHSPHIHFTGRLPWDDMYTFKSQAVAHIALQKEDFGISMVESLALGTPVLAINQGGALEFVKSNLNGLFINKLDNKTISQALEKIFNKKWKRKKIQQSVIQFDQKVFQQKLLNQIKRTMKKSP